LYELGLTVTSIHLSKTDKYKSEDDEKEYRYFELYLTDKDGVKSVWFPPKYHECLWTDCVIYQDLEKDAACCMRYQIPMLYEPSIGYLIDYLKYLQEKGYHKFYQVVGYRASLVSMIIQTAILYVLSASRGYFAAMRQKGICL
jgi:hypothetical protein